MARRAADAGTPISHVSLSDYATGKVTSMPSETTRKALANALDVDVSEVTAAAIESAAPDRARDSDDVTQQHAQAFLRLTAGRSAAEIDQLLGVVEATLSAMRAARRTESPHSPDE